MSTRFAVDQMIFLADTKYQDLKTKYENLIKEHVTLEERYNEKIKVAAKMANTICKLRQENEEHISFERQLVDEWNEQQRMLEEQRTEINNLNKGIEMLGEIVFNHIDGPNMEGYNPYQE